MNIDHIMRVLFSIAITMLVVVGTIYAIKYLRSVSAEQPNMLLIQNR